MELSRKITARVHAKRLSHIEDDIVKPCMREERFEILIDMEPYAVISGTPCNQKELVAGYLISSGIIGSRNDIVSCRLCESNRFYVILGEESMLNIRAAGGVAQYVRSGAPVNHENISAVNSVRLYTPEEIATICRIIADNEELQNIRSLGFYAGVVREGKIISLFFDIKGVNVLDKLIGSLAGGEPFDGMLITNARPSTDIIMRCYTAKVPIGIFNGIPSNGGLNFAKKAAITVVSKDKPREYLVFADSARRIRKI